MSIRRAEFEQCFTVEALEPRVMLSADGFGVGAAVTEAGPRVELLVDEHDLSGDDFGFSDAAENFGIEFEAPAAMAEENVVTWDNAAGGDWAEAANWVGGVVPQAGDAVVITGLASDETEITFTGATPVLESLEIDRGKLTVNGSLNVGDITGTGSGNITVTGSGSSAITGDVAMAAAFQVFGGAAVTWSGSVWNQAAFIYVDNTGSTFTQQSGVFTGPGDNQFAVGAGGALNLNGGQFNVPTGGTFNLYHDSQLTINGGTLNLAGGEVSAFNESVVDFTSGLITGAGNFKVNNQLNVSGTIRPGGAGTAGTINFIQGEDNTDGAINFSGAWAIELKALSGASFDQVTFDATVDFAGTGAVAIDASAADFSGTAIGSTLTGMFTVDGSLTGTPTTIDVTPGTIHAVTAAWNGTAIDVTTDQLKSVWTDATGGSWSDTANWLNARLPLAGESVAISGLNAGATVTVDAVDLALTTLTSDGVLALDGSTLTVDTSFSAVGLTLSNASILILEGAATGTVSGDVAINDTSKLQTEGTAQLTQSGGIWALNDSGELRIIESSGFTQSGGTFRSNATSTVHAVDDGTWTLSGGIYELIATANAELFDAAVLTISGGDLGLLETSSALRSLQPIVFSAGLLTGRGNLIATGGITVSGTIRPDDGSTGTGELRITGGGAIDFTNAWAIELDVAAESVFDQLALTGTVTFGGTGAVEINASGVDFSAVTDGTNLANLITITGSITGSDATVNVTGGAGGSVTATWSGTALNASTTGGVPATTLSDTVNDGINSGTTTHQGMLPSYNLGTIDFVGQGRTALVLPTLPNALNDLFNLTAINGSLALPTIGSASTVAATITALEAAGYTVTTPGGGADLVATLTRSIFSDRAVDSGFAGANFEVPSDLLVGVADQLSLTAVLTLTSSLMQHVAFELRDGVFNLLDESYLALALAGGATLSGTARHGSRTVTATGSSTITSLEVRLRNSGADITATAAGAVEVDVSLEASPVTLVYGRDYTLTRTTDTLVTSTATATTLAGTLTIDGVTDSEGVATTFALTGTQAGDGNSWTLTGTGSDVQWLAFAVSGWSFSVTLGAESFNGTGSFTTALDFLSASGSAPEVSLNAAFDQEELTFTGTLNSSAIAVTNPAGGTYLGITDFASTSSITGNLSTGVWAGQLTFTGGESSFDPAGDAFTATITDGDDADAIAVSGTYDFGAQSFTTTVDQFEMVAANVLRVAAAGVTLRHQRNVTTEQELLSMADVPVELLFLTGLPSTGPPTATAASIALRTNGVTVGAGSLTLDEISIGSVLNATGVSLSFNSFSFLDGTTASDGVTLAADAATLFPSGGVFTATATGLNGTYDFSQTSDRVALTAGTLNFAIPGMVDFAATDVAIRPEGEAVFSAATIDANVEKFGLTGQINGLEISSAGTPSAVSFSLDTSSLSETLDLAGLLPLGITGVAVDFLGDTNYNGVRDTGEVFRLDAFDLTVTGNFDFSVLNALPFTPVIKIGSTEFGDNTQTLALTLRFDAGAFRIWNTETITLGVSEFDLGSFARISGTITLGGYTNGVWAGDFDGSLEVTSLSSFVSGNAAATLTGAVDVSTGTVTVGTVATLNLGLGSAMTLANAALTTNFTITRTGGGGLQLAITEASATVGTLSVGSLFEASTVAVTLNDLGVSGSGVTLGSVAFGADSATVLPGNTLGITATTTGFSGSYNLAADPDTFELSAAAVNFALGTELSFEATNVTLTPLADTLLAVGSVNASLPDLGVDGTVIGFELSKDGTPSAISVSVDGSGLADSLNLGGVLPLTITTIVMAPSTVGGRVEFNDFDLTVNGTINFGSLAGLPFTPVIGIDGEFSRSTDATPIEFSITARLSGGVFQVWNTPTITLGIENLTLGDVFKIDGSVTLGGYSDGIWGGSFDGSLIVTSTHATITNSATAILSGAINIETGVITIGTVATLDLGISDQLTLSEAVATTNFTISRNGSAVALAVNTATLQVGTFRAGSVFEASDVGLSLTGLTISGAGVALDSITFSAGSATLLPGNSLGITATTTGITGSYDFTTDPDTFELTADTMDFVLADKVSFNATAVSITPHDEVIFSVATVSANLPGMGIDGEVTGFELAADGTPSATSVLLDTSGLAESLGLGGVLPFNVDTIALNPPDEGERIEFDNFDLTVAGTIDFSGLDGLPFTPSITIDGQTSRSDDETAAEFSFTVRLDDGEIQIWETPTISLGVEDLEIGELLAIEGSMTLGGYTDGVWSGKFGGALTVTSLNENVTGNADTTVTGSVDVSTGTITVFTEATLDLGIGTDVVLTAAVASVDFTIRDDESDGLVLAIDEANLAVGTLAVGSIFEATDVFATLVDLTVSGAGVTLGSISFSAASATLLPDNDLGITAETTGITGRYDFSTNPDTFELTAESVTFELADVVSFNAAGVSLTPLDDVVLAVDSAEATLAGLDSSAAVTGFELASDGTPSATSIELDTEGLADSLQLGGMLPLNVTAIALAGTGEGERITFTDFELTVKGNVDFRVFAGLPFKPFITIGEQTTRSDDETAAEFSFTVRIEDGGLQVLDSPTITLGIEDLQIGNVLEIDGRITLGGYSEGEWVGAFGGLLTVTALQVPEGADGAAPTSITVEVNGQHEVDAGTLQMNVATAISFGLGENISFVDAGIEVDFTLRYTEDDGLELLNLGVTATAETMTVGSILTASAVRVGFSGFSITSEGIGLDSIQLSAGAAALFPDSAEFTATATDFSGAYDFTAEGSGFELTVGGLSFAVGDLVTFDASDVVLRPEAEVVMSIGEIAVDLPGIGTSGTITGFELTSAAVPSAVSLTLDTSGLSGSLQLGGILPFDLQTVSARFLGDTNGNGERDEGEIFRLDEFDLSVDGTFDFEVLSALPFTPIVRIGDASADDGTDSFSFTIRVVDGTLTPWDVGPIELGVADLAIGSALVFGGTIRLGGYVEGVWVPNVGGSLDLAGGSNLNGVTGSLSVEIDGSWTEETGVLEVGASFLVSFTLGDYVEVTDAAISLSFDLTTQDSGGDFELGLTNLEVGDVSIKSLSVSLGDVLSMSATSATMDFEATGDEALIEVGSLAASLSGLGISGTAQNFAVAADGGLLLRENFGVSLELGEDGVAGLSWPDWLPIEVTVFEVKWDDIEADPLDFTLRLSGTISTEGLSGSKLTLAGSVSNLIIDVGLLRDGAFPIVGLGEVGIAVGGDIAGSAVSAQLLLGILRVDADGQRIADDDTTTVVADRVLWGAVRGGIEIAGYGGFEVFLGVSQYGPLQGYVKAVVVVPVDPTGLTGLSLTNFRAGITFNSELPAIDDPKELAEHPEFVPTADLSFTDWRDVMLDSLTNQLEAIADNGAFGLLLNPFRLEGGVTLFSSSASQAAFNIDADFIMDSTGKFVALGAFQIGGTINFTASLYLDLSDFVADGDATILFLGQLPSELPIVTLYGRLSFNFGETVDPDNPPANPLEQFVIEISGGMDVGIASLPTFTVEGEVAFEVALNAPSLRVIFSGRATISQVGDLVGISGDMRIFFGEDDTVKVAGVAALAPAEMTQLQDIGLTLDALAVMRFNTTESAIDQTLEIPGQAEPRTFTLAPGEGSILIEGVAGFAPGGVELFRLGGLLNLTWTADGFDVLASGELTAGPADAPLLRFGADGYLRLVVEGINVGMAAQFTLTLDPDNDLLAAVGVELDGAYAFVMNTTGEDVDFTLPTELAATAPVERINLPRGPPAADGATSGEAMSYLFVRADGILTIQDAVELRGVFDFTVADSVVALDYEAVVWLGFGEITFYELAAEGHFRIDDTGLYGQADLTLDLSAGIPAAAQAFDFEATFQLQVNTTGEAKTLGEIELAEGTYARVRATGDLIVGLTKMSGVFDLLVDETGVLVTAVGSVSLGIGDTPFYTWGYNGTLRIQSDGIYGSLELSVSNGNTDAWGFGFVDSASYTLALNTTGGVIGGVPAGLGAQVTVTGALELGDWTLDGTYTLTASTTGLSFGAAAALVFRDGEQTLFSVPVNFEVTLNFPGIRERVVLDLDPADLGLEVPGLALSGEFYFVINTTPDATEGIPAGPILQLGLAGAVTVGGAELAGSWTFDSSLSRTRMTGDFTVGLGGSGDDALLRFVGAGGLNLGLDGVAGYTDLTYTGAVDSLDGLLDAGLTYHLVVNTSTAPYELGDRTLPKGPLVEVSASGDLNVGGLTLNGDYGLTVSADGILLDLDATLAVTLGEDAMDLFTFDVAGGLALGSAGLVAALDLKVQNNAFADVGLGFNGGADFRLRVNTTGTDQSVGDIELEQGNYARVEFSGVLNIGVFYLAGDFSLQAEDGTADLTMNAEMYAQLPDTPEASFRFGAVGGLRIEAAGVVAALDLDAGNALQLDGMEFPIGAEQTVALRLNTTGQERTVNGITLAKGNYFSLETVGTLILGPYLVEGTFGFTAADTGFTVHASAQLGIGVQDSEFMRFRIEGEMSITAAGTYALLSLVTELGDGHDDYGFGFGAGATVTLGFNSTDNEVNGVPAHSAWALVVTGTLQLGDEANGGALTGQFSVTPTVQNTLLWHGETAFVLTTGGEELVNLAFEFDYEMEFPGMAMRIELPLDTDRLLDIPGLTYDGDFYLEFNATDQDVPWDTEATIPAGPAARLVFDGTLGTAVTALNGRFAFQGDGDGVRMLAGFTYGLGPDAANPWVSFDAEGAFVVSAEGFAGYAKMTVAAGLDALAGPLGGELTHTLLLNTTATAVTVGDHKIEGGPRAELLSSGTLDLLGLAMVGDFRLSGSGDGFSMEADANLEIRVPFTNIALLKVPVEGGFTISDKGFSAAFDVLPETAFFEPVGLAFGSTARYALRVNTTGEARTENGIELEAGSYGRVDASGTMQLGDLVFDGGYTFQVDADLVRFGVNADVTWELPVAGSGPTGELFSFATVGQLGIGVDGVVGALDLTTGSELERLQLGEIEFDVSGGLAWKLRLNTTGSERVVEGVTLGANEVFMFETNAAFALGPLAVSGLTRFTAGDEMVRVETTATVSLTNPATDDELITADWIGGFEVSDAGVAGYGELTGATAGAGLANTGLDFLAESAAGSTTTLSFNTTGSAVELEEHVVEAVDHFEVATAGQITVLGQTVTGAHAFRVEGDVVTLNSDGAMIFGIEGVLGFALSTEIHFTFSGDGVVGTGAATMGASGATINGFMLQPEGNAALAFALNSTGVDVEQDGTLLKAGSVTLAGAFDLTLFDQTFSGQTLLTLDFEHDLVAVWQDGRVSMSLGDWTPFNFDYSGYFVMGADGVAMRIGLDRVGNELLAGVNFSGEWEVRASTFTEAVTLPAFTVGGLDVPEIAIEAGNRLRFHLTGAIEAGGMSIGGEFDFEKTSVEFRINAAGSVDFFGVTASFEGQMYIHPDRGLVANVGMTWGGIDNAFMELSGQAFLRLNTWDGVWEGVTANTFEIGINDGVLRLGFSELRGAAAFQWSAGEARLWTDMTFSPIPGLSAQIDGFISTGGTYDLTFQGSTDGAFGVDGLMTLTGSYEGRLSNAGLSGSWDGRIDWPTDYSSFKGSFAITGERMELHLALPRTWLLGIGIISGEVTIVAEGGRLALSAAEAAPLRMELPGGLFEAEVWGTISNTGTIDFNGRAGVDLGEQSLMRVRGDIAVRVSNSGFAGTISGRIDLLDHDYTGYAGEVRFTDGEFFMSLDVQRVWLLGVGIISGRIETYQVGNLVGFNVDESSPLRLEVVGGFFEAEIWGHIWSDGVINFNGRAAIDVGSTGLLRATANLDVHVDNNGFSAAATGEFSVLGSTSRYTGSIEVGSWGFDLNIDQVEIALLGGMLSLEGGARFYQRSTYFDASLLGMTAQLQAPGLADSRGTVSGYVTSSGRFELNGGLYFDIGDQRFIRLRADADVHINNDGFSGSMSGRIDVMNHDYTGVAGSLVIRSDGDFAMSLDLQRVWLLGLGIISGRIDAYNTDGRVGFAVAESSPLTLEAAGGLFEATVWGYVWSDGQINLNGRARVDVGDTTLGLAADLGVQVDNDGLRADVSGTLYVPGDSAGFTGTLVADAGGFDISGTSRFVLAGGLVLLDGSLGMSHRNGTLSVAFQDIRLESRIPGWDTNLTVDGYIRSDGDFYLSGTADLNIGNSTLGLDATVTLTVRDEGIGGEVSGRLFVPGDYADFSGSFEAGVWGFNLHIERVRFALLSGAIILDGSMIFEMRGSSFALWIVGMTGEIRLPGFTQTFAISGSLDSQGNFDLSGTARLDIGSSHIGATGDIELRVRNSGISGSLRGTVYVPGDYAGISGTFSADADGFEINISRVRFVVLGGTLLIDGSLRLISRNGGLYISVPGASVTMWGITGSVSGYFDSANGTWRVDGSVRFYYGGNFGAEGTISFDVGHDHARAHASGKAWAQADYWFFGWRTYRDWASFSANVDLGDGRLDVRMKFWKFYVTVHVRLKGGFRVWLSNVGGSTVFLDVNRNGVLDNGEPFTLTDADGNFDFAEVADPDAEGNEVLEGEAPETVSSLGRLAAFDLDGDGVLAGDEIQLYAVNGISGTENSDFRLVYHDDNGNGRWDGDNETSFEVGFEELSALSQTSTTVTGTRFEIFDNDGDGVLSNAESASLSLELMGARVPLTLLPNQATGGVTVKDAEFVFADANDNGQYDPGEPTATPDAFGIYTFLDGVDAAPTTSLGRLAPFDTNGNGRIDPSEGVFVVIGGTDTDNGVANPVAATALAEGYGGGIEQTINPLTSLQVSLVDRGMSIDDAADLIENAFNLPRGVDVDSFDPNADSFGDPVAEAAALGAGAMVTSLVTGGAGLLGDDSSAGLQDAVLDQLADVLLAVAATGSGQVDLTDGQTLATVIAGAGVRVGREIDETVANAAAHVLMNVNVNIAETVAAGGNLDRALAANKAVFLTDVNASLTNLGNGTANAADVESQFSDEALDALQGEVTLLPTIAPSLVAVDDQLTLGSDLARITLAVLDPDSRASELSFTVASSNESVVSGEAVSFENNNGEWTMLVPTAALATGTTVLSVTVSDGDATVSTAFTLSLDGINPVVRATAEVPNQTLGTGETTTLNLADFFDDPNGDATYSLVTIGANRTVDAVIVDGQLVLTARSDLSGLAVFDLVATDGHGTARTRFSVVSYPTVSVSDEVRYTNDGRIEMDVALSNPATQSLSLRYHLAADDPTAATPLSGRLTFAPGETTRTLSIDLASSGFGDVRVQALAFGVTGSWATGSFAVDVNNRNPVELLDLWNRPWLSFDFTLGYDFIADAADEEADLAGVLTDVELAPDAAIEVVARSESVASASRTTGSDLVAATSLEALKRTRTLSGI